MRIVRISLFILAGLIAALLLLMLVGLLVARLRSPDPSTLEIGLNAGEFAPCPDSPNCVSTMAPDGEHRVPPITYAGPRRDALEAAREVLEGMARTRIVETDDAYLHAESRSALFRYVDDVEIYLPEGEGLLHFRSASRVGYSDMGANRKRYEAFAAAFQDELEG